MYDNYNYPPGADGPDAPWNQPPDPDPIDVDVCVSYSISKSTTVTVSDYIMEQWEDWDVGDEGETIHDGGIDYNFSDCNFKKVYEEDKITLVDIINKCKELAEEKLKEESPSSSKWVYLVNLIEACEDWHVDELEVVEE